MAVLKSQNNIEQAEENYLFNNFYWFYSNIYKNLQKAADDFFQNEFQLRFMGISYENNIFFYGDEYFVNKIPVNKTSSIIVRISSNLVSSLLDSALGRSESLFALKKLTDIEAMLINSFTVFSYKNIENFLNKAEVNKKILQSSKECNFTFYVRKDKTHTGKIILTVPEYMIPKIKSVSYGEIFNIKDFKTAKAEITIKAGSAKIALNDIKDIENGDIIVLDNSDINKMNVIWDNNEIKFKINPNPSLIISIDNNGGNKMEDQTVPKPQNMWDSILVDIVAEFDNVKLTLGELKQISDGLVIDLGSIYDNKIKLRVENQIVATGELVILNDRYGVRIDNVKKSKEESVKPVSGTNSDKITGAKKPVSTAKSVEAKPLPSRPVSVAKKPVKSPAPVQKPQQAANTEGNENFDYSDFEIEDESI